MKYVCHGHLKYWNWLGFFVVSEQPNKSKIVCFAMQYKIEWQQYIYNEHKIMK